MGFPVTESARLRHHAFTVMALGQLLHSVPIKYVLSGANSQDDSFALAQMDSFGLDKRMFPCIILI